MSLYSVHPGVRMVRDWIESLPARTGRSLAQWMAFIEREGPAGEVARRAWLKEEHGLGTNAAWWLAERSVGKGGEEDDDESYLRTAEAYVEGMFAGKRAGLRPLYDRLLELGLGLGGDVKACPCKTMVPLYREHVFAQIKPATNSRIDLGLCLRGVAPKGRLLSTGGEAKGDRITHRIAIGSLEDIDEDAMGWLRRAYAAAEPGGRAEAKGGGGARGTGKAGGARAEKAAASKPRPGARGGAASRGARGR